MQDIQVVFCTARTRNLLTTEHKLRIAAAASAVARSDDALLYAAWCRCKRRVRSVRGTAEMLKSAYSHGFATRTIFFQILWYMQE